VSNNKHTALITGGSRGIGKAIAIEFAKHGIDVIITGRNRERLASTSKVLERHEVKSHYIDADLGQVAGAERICEFIANKGIGVNILVNNAAVIHPRMPLMELSMDDWEEVVNVNLLGAVRITKMLLPHMITKKWGKIINISSIGGRKGAAGRSAYRATKAALISFTESLASEVKSYGIDVNCICPGRVATEGYAEAFGDEDMQRYSMMDPSEIATLCYFLVGPGASAITGAVVDAFGPSNPLFSTNP
tara:strand:- start:480 stop:1223 length:744 start_codon:yes stop_codon:yes gene_type:complete